MIPEAAVEAAARASAGAFGEEPNKRDLAHVRLVLEAAAPHMEPTIKPRTFYRIQALALRAAFHEFPLETIAAPDNAATWLKRRADDLDHRAEVA